MQIGLICHTVIFNKERKILIIKRSVQENPYPNFWDMPGGTVEEGEDPQVGAMREIKEEIGLDVKDLVLISQESNVDKDKNKQFVCFNFIGPYTGDKITLNPEAHSEYKWIDFRDIPNYQSIPSMQNLPPVLERYFKNF